MTSCSECRHWEKSMDWWGSCLHDNAPEELSRLRRKDYNCSLFEQKGVSMETCKECKWWALSNDKVNGICFNPRKSNKLLYGPTAHCILFESREVTMKICRECKWWERSQRFWGGLCSKLGVGHEKIIRWDEKEDDAGITRHPYTFENFSCMHFEKKSKESDVLFHYAWVEQSKWIIYYRSDQNDALPVYITREYDALQACNWLNKHWQQRNETDE